jgi:3-hydroxyisobutyrate dehydrogenase-like beta-hydroxyacid dehydrogenase
MGPGRAGSTPPGPARICLLGLGEAGAGLAADLVAAGVDVVGYDPAPVPTPSGVSRQDDPAAAVASADIVLALVPSDDVSKALDQVLDALPRAAIYADLSTAAPRTKRELAGIAAAAGVDYVDVALMAPVPGTGLRTPALASGPAAEAFASALQPLGMPVEVAGDTAGQAAQRKLLRSVVMKGLAALLIEALQAAEAAGVRAETWDNLVAQLTAIDEGLVRRLVTGTGAHAGRRVHEMEATVDLLTELGVEPTMTRATLARLRQVIGEIGETR